MGPALSVADLSFDYRRKPVLLNITFPVARGTICGRPRADFSIGRKVSSCYACQEAEKRRLNGKEARKNDG